jgi:hypothetical protein
MTKNSAERDRAELRFAAAQARRFDQWRAKLEHEEEARTGYEKTAKLRSLRLAKEAAEAAEKALAVSKKPRPRKARTSGAGESVPTSRS